jgi:DNA-binding transcriptional LysR family regulator
MDRFFAIDAFVRVAEAQRFAEAARQMRVSRSVLTARIQGFSDHAPGTCSDSACSRSS